MTCAPTWETITWEGPKRKGYMKYTTSHGYITHAISGEVESSAVAWLVSSGLRI